MIDSYGVTTGSYPYVVVNIGFGRGRSLEFVLKVFWKLHFRIKPHVFSGQELKISQFFSFSISFSVCFLIRAKFSSRKTGIFSCKNQFSRTPDLVKLV